ncbi:MAG TPA: FAD-dependent oxidoreductase [Methylomirabilota bacterium]|nr:FAD-dependent oxidoreductase [Methylomirabilota bacterium]
MKQSHIVVIGGGMSGTAAANTLFKLGHTVTIVEKNDRLGGRIHSITTDNFTFELGAGFLTDIYFNTFRFLKETGLDKNLQRRKSKSAIVKHGVAHTVTAPSTIFGNSFISHGAKIKLLAELVKVVPTLKHLDVKNFWQAYPYDNKSVSEAFKGKYGQEVLDFLIQPMLEGYFYWSADTTSRAMLLVLFKAAAARGHTYILKNGLQRIPELAAKGCEILLAHEVKEVQKLSENEYEVVTNKKTLKADGIVCATTASFVSKIFKNLTDTQLKFFSSVQYSSTAIVAKTYKPKATPSNYAIGYPRKEKNPLGAITIVSDANKETTLVKLFASGVYGKELCKKSDETIEKTLSTAATASKNIFDISINPTSQHIQRWQEALPHFDVGHFQRLKTFMNGEIESKDERIVFAGDYIGGPFIEGAFTSGIQAAERLEKRFSLG